MFIWSSSLDEQSKVISYISTRDLPQGTDSWIWTSEQMLEFCRKPQNKWCAKVLGEQVLSLVMFTTTEFQTEIQFLETNPGFLRQGHMMSLLKHLMENGEAPDVWVDVHSENRAALKLYMSLGFEIVGKRKSYYQDGGDNILMTHHKR